jgi:AmiR/NasT family two-component response regulator
MTAARILIVVDEFIAALSLADGLRGEGFDVIGIAPTGDEAIAMASRLRPDLVVVDIGIQDGRDGIDTAVQICERLDLSIVFLSALSDEDTVRRAKAAGAYGFLTKPLTVAGAAGHH